MPYKCCPACRQISYSAAENPIWYCPCCGEDLGSRPAIHDARSLTGLRPQKKGILCELKKRSSV